MRKKSEGEKRKEREQHALLLFLCCLGRFQSAFVLSIILYPSAFLVAPLSLPPAQWLKLRPTTPLSHPRWHIAISSTFPHFPCIFPALHALTHIFICLIFLSNTFPLFALPSCIIFSLHPPRFRIFRTPTYWETFAVSNSFFMSMSTKSYHNRTHNRVAFGIFSRLPEKHLSGYNSYADSMVELFFTKSITMYENI